MLLSQKDEILLIKFLRRQGHEHVDHQLSITLTTAIKPSTRIHPSIHGLEKKIRQLSRNTSDKKIRKKGFFLTSLPKSSKWRNSNRKGQQRVILWKTGLKVPGMDRGERQGDCHGPYRRERKCPLRKRSPPAVDSVAIKQKFLWGIFALRQDERSKKRNITNYKKTTVMQNAFSAKMMIPKCALLLILSFAFSTHCIPIPNSQIGTILALLNM